LKRIIVTGGAGFIGSVLVKRLFELYGHKFAQLLVIDKLTYAANITNLGSSVNNPKFDLKIADISVIDDISPLIKDGDLIFHLAAESHVDNSISDGEAFWRTNTVGTSNILELMKHRKGIRLLYVSTDEVYGSIQNGSFSEESTLNPNSPYSASKAAGDLACIAYFKTHGLDVNITRCSNNFGSEQHGEKFLPVIVNNLLNSKSVPIYGNGSNVREWIPAWVHSEYLIRIMYSNITGQIFNIGSGYELENITMARFAAKTLNRNLEIQYIEDRKAHDFRYSLDISKISKLFGVIHYSPSEELAKTILDLNKLN